VHARAGGVFGVAPAVFSARLVGAAAAHGQSRGDSGQSAAGLSDWRRRQRPGLAAEVSQAVSDVRRLQAVVSEADRHSGEPGHQPKNYRLGQDPGAQADAGVALALVPEIKVVPISGAAKWLTPEKAMIGLNLRGKSNDRFWFTFFHEAGHILNDRKKETFTESTKMNDLQQDSDAKNDSPLMIAAKFGRLFVGVNVMLIPDRDRAGEDVAQHSGRVLRGIAKSIRIAVLPGEFKESNGEDVRDVLRRPDGQQQVEQAIADAQPTEPIENDAAEKETVPHTPVGDVSESVTAKEIEKPVRPDIQKLRIAELEGRRDALQQHLKNAQNAVDEAKKEDADRCWGLGKPPTPASLETVQHGGRHYKGMAIQPAEYCHKNGFKFCESEAIKYLSRFRSKKGEEDVRKAIHFCQMILDMEYSVQSNVIYPETKSSKSPT